MSLMKVELHTSVELEIGAKLTGEIKPLESLDGQENGKALAVSGKAGRRVRTIGYINSTPQYVSVVAEQVIAAMEEVRAETIELDVLERIDQQIDGRSIYILNVADIDVATLILGTSLAEGKQGQLLDIINSVDEVKEGEEVKTVDKSLNTVELVQRAIDELSGNNSKSITEAKAVNTKDTLKTIRLGVGGASRSNPLKMTVIQHIKSGMVPEVTLQKGKDGVINVMYQDKAAGELEFTEVDEMIDIETVQSIEIDGVKPFGYYVNITLIDNLQELAITVDTEEVTDRDSLFVELIKPVIKEMSNDVKSLNSQDIANNHSVINNVWSLVSKVRGEEVCEDVCEEVESNTSELNKVSSDTKKVAVKKAKKITKEGMKKVMTYLTINDIPTKYIEKIIKSYKEYPIEYLDRIPSFEDEDFVPWKYEGKGPNLLKLAIIAIEKGKNLRLVGGKGAGKNTLLKTLAAVYQRPSFSQSANRDTDITHLFGDKTIDVVEVEGQISQIVEFEKGLLIEAMEVGGFYELGEGNACRPEVTMALHSILDSRREADVNGYKLVKAHEDFVFTLTMNVDYEGCNSLNQAFRDRFTTIPFPSPTSIATILREACPNASSKDIRICDRLYSDILTRVEELQTDEVVTIRGYINALDLAEDLSLKEALQMCVAYNVSDDEIIVQEILEIIDSVVA